MELTQVLLKPRITEKVTELKTDGNTVAFLVHPKANKLEIKKAVETAFNVTVLDVNVVYYFASYTYAPGSFHRHETRF